MKKNIKSSTKNVTICAIIKYNEVLKRKQNSKWLFCS